VDFEIGMWNIYRNDISLSLFGGCRVNQLNSCYCTELLVKTQGQNMGSPRLRIRYMNYVKIRHKREIVLIRNLSNFSWSKQFYFIAY
jgi:hypothetical protein